VTRLPRYALLLALAAGCVGGTRSLPRPVIQSFPGFDTGLYPGDESMRAWVRPNSPYHWVGYYLPAPCHRDTSWSGRRNALAAMGWGMAVLYVGQQTWDGVPERAPTADTLRAPGDTLRAEAAQRSITCSRTLLTAAQGTAEADDAIAKTVGDGFAAGTLIFLDIERMTTIPTPMRDYYRAWVGRVLADGRFRPAIYAHQRNAAEIYADVRTVFDAAGIRDEPSFWITGPSSSFTLTSAASDVGFRFARGWQGVLNTAETWNGVTLRVDVNVADSPSPSTAGPVVANANQSAPARAP
jgi:hypothetical protein